MNVPFNAGEDAKARLRARETQTVYPITEAHSGRRHTARGRTAVEQARLILLVMLNVAQLWILAATVEAALARQYQELLPLVIASACCSSRGGGMDAVPGSPRNASTSRTVPA